MIKGVRCGIIIAAGGQGSRLKSEERLPKQFLKINGTPLLAKTLKNVCMQFFDEIILVLPEEWIGRLPFELPHLHTAPVITAGGKTRQESVCRGLSVLPEDIELVAVHDAARPFATEAMIAGLMEAAALHGAAIPVVPVKDTLKLAENSYISATIDRSCIVQVQTPQVFRTGILRDAYEKAEADDFEGTDDASLVERIGGKVFITEGSYYNIKITTNEDLLLAANIANLLQKE